MSSKKTYKEIHEAADAGDYGAITAETILELMAIAGINEVTIDHSLLETIKDNDYLELTDSEDGNVTTIRFIKGEVN